MRTSLYGTPSNRSIVPEAYNESRTKIELYETIDDKRLAARAIARYQEYCLRSTPPSRSRSLSAALSFGFDWDATPEGYIYWEMIYNGAQYIESQDPKHFLVRIIQ